MSPIVETTETPTQPQRVYSAAANRADRVLSDILSFLCILIFAFGFYSFYDAMYLYNNAFDKSALVYRPEKGEVIQEENRVSEDQIAWLEIDDANISFPVMYSGNNYEYLNKDVYGEFSLSGSIFLDGTNSPDFSDPYSLIHGHHMERGAMFGALDRFRNEEFFLQHRYGTLTTTEKEFELEIYAVFEAEVTEPMFLTPGDSTNEEIIREARMRSIYYRNMEFTDDTHLVAMSTCTGGDSVSRLIVLSVIREEK